MWETPYVKLLTQMFGDRALIANATGCSSIYETANHPIRQNADGRGPTWNNSLFEDNAEFGFGFRLAIDNHKEQAEILLNKMADKIGQELVIAILEPTSPQRPDCRNSALASRNCAKP